MTERSAVSLAVRSWSAWAPGISGASDWRRWASGEVAISGPIEPDVKFVAPMMRRRLSGLTRMAFRAAADCLEDHDVSPAFVFCSRYGEYARSFGILEGLSGGEPASAAAFSMSVHNTATSLFAIETKDQSASTALAGGEATLETGFIEAWSLLVNRAADSVLLVYHDEKLPDLYRDLPSTVGHPAALAMLLQRPEDAGDAFGLNLTWAARNDGESAAQPATDPALQVLKLLVDESDTFALDTGRLVWTWSSHHAAG